MRLRALLAAAIAAPLATSALPAVAEDTCFGFPDVPDAFVCVVSVTPENAVPVIEPGATTVWIPEICIAVCVGPTPVPIPSATANGGSVAVIRYRGEDYPVGTSGSVPGTNLPEHFTGHGCGMLVGADPAQPGGWHGVLFGGPVTATDPGITITHTRCVLHDGPLDEPDQVAEAPGLITSKGAAVVPPTVVSFTFDAGATPRYCLRMVWNYDAEPSLSFGEEICTAPTGAGIAYVVV